MNNYQIAVITGFTWLFISGMNSAGVSQKKDLVKSDTALPVELKQAFQSLDAVDRQKDREIEKLKTQIDNRLLKIDSITVNSEERIGGTMDETYNKAQVVIKKLRRLKNRDARPYMTHLSEMQPITYCIPDPKPVDLPEVKPVDPGRKGFFKRMNPFKR